MSIRISLSSLSSTEPSPARILWYQNIFELWRLTYVVWGSWRILCWLWRPFTLTYCLILVTVCCIEIAYCTIHRLSFLFCILDLSVFCESLNRVRLLKNPSKVLPSFLTSFRMAECLIACWARASMVFFSKSLRWFGPSFFFSLLLCAFNFLWLRFLRLTFISTEFLLLGWFQCQSFIFFFSSFMCYFSSWICVLGWKMLLFWLAWV